jgi:hypothetical protein
MQLKIGHWYTTKHGQMKCISIKRNKATFENDCFMYKNVPCSLIYIKNCSQVFKDYK